MKKLLTIALAALTLTACTQHEEPTSQQEIGFTAYSLMPSRSIVNGTEFPTDGTLYITAKYNDTEDYFTNQAFTNASGTWKGTTSYYWPLQNSMDFVAYAVIGDAAATATATYGTNSYTGLNLDFTGNELDGTSDVMVASTNNVTCPQAGPVDLKFYHALAQLQFTVEGSGDVKVTKLEVNSPVLNGKMAASGMTGTTAPTFTWSEATAEANAYVNYDESAEDGNPTILSDKAATLGNGVLVVPADNSFAGFTITYQLKNGENYTAPMTYVYNVPTDATWAAGKKYTYAITITPKEITVAPEVSDYEGEAASQVEI